MTRYHATSEGNIAFTSNEETQSDIEDAAHAANILPNLIKSKLKDLDVKALEVNSQGVTVGGMEIDSDDEAVANITSALSLIARKPLEAIDFLARSGWGSANKAALEAMQDSIWELRKATNANQKTHSVAISALTTAQNVTDYDISTGW